MRRTRNLVVAAAAATTLSLLASKSRATDYTWSQLGAGTYNWNVNGNWGGAGFPNTNADLANINVASTGNLNIALPGNFTVGTLALGSTGGAFTTDVGAGNSGAGSLIYDNVGTITSGGAVGAINIISAPIQLGVLISSGTTTLTGDHSLTINNGMTLLMDNVGTTAVTRTLNNNLTAGTLVINGTVNLAQVGATNSGTLLLLGSGNTTINAVISNGGIGSGKMQYGTVTAAAVVPNITLSGANTYSGVTVLNRATMIVDSDSAFGTGELRDGNPSNAFGFNLVSTDDSRQIHNQFRIGQNRTIEGTHSLTISAVGTGTGAFATNAYFLNANRAVVNLLPAGKTFTIAAPAYGNRDTDNNRILQFDGPGKTVMTGGIFDRYLTATGTNDTTDGINGLLSKIGRGVLTVSGPSTYHGSTTVNGGLLMFADTASYGNTSSVVMSGGGAIGVVTGTLSNTDFLNRIAAGAVGALALNSTEVSTPINFNTLPANAQGMSIGAVEGGLSISTAITPVASLYRLGGGGTVTLTNASNNALTGANGVDIANGGVVVINGTNNYTGVTTVIGEAVTSNEARAIANLATPANAINAPTVLQISSLPAAGSASPIGTSGAAASLVLNGGTLRYVGGAQTTDRQFSLGVRGGGLDSSGAGPLVFSSTAAIPTDGAVTTARSLTLAGTNGGDNTLNGILSDVAASSGTLSVVKNDGGKWILAGTNTYTGGNVVNGGTLVAPRFANKLNIAAGGRAQLSVKATANDSTGVAKLSLANLVIAGTSTVPTATLDLANNSLVIDYTSPTDTSPLQDTRLRLKAGLATGLGIVTSSATVNTRLGYAESALVLGPTGGTYQGQTVDADAVIVKYTYGGDTNLDGKVDVADLGALATAWQQTGVWSNGDSDYSGFVDVADLGILSTNWQKGVTNPPPLGPSFAAALAAFGLPNVSVPEPTSLALLALGGSALLRRRRA